MAWLVAVGKKRIVTLLLGVFCVAKNRTDVMITVKAQTLEVWVRVTFNDYGRNPLLCVACSGGSFGRHGSVLIPIRLGDEINVRPIRLSATWQLEEDVCAPHEKVDAYTTCIRPTRDTPARWDHLSMSSFDIQQH